VDVGQIVSGQAVDARVVERKKRMEVGRLVTAVEGRHKWPRKKW
jgi:hypothetical protein